MFITHVQIQFKHTSTGTPANNSAKMSRLSGDWLTYVRIFALRTVADKVGQIKLSTVTDGV